MIAIVDYGVGNLFSLTSSLKKIGRKGVVTGDAGILGSADGIILPGVGAFGDASDKLRQSGLFDVIKELASNGKPLLGICLGMQLLFEKSYEYGEHEGLGLIEGSVVPLKDYVEGLKIPHMGWNSLDIIIKDNPILKYTDDGDYVYFVHSYFGLCKNSGELVATCRYGRDVTAVVSSGNIFGTQFHPEKSGGVGLKILQAFCQFAEGGCVC